MADAKSSLPLAVATYFHGLYSPALVVALLLTFIYKGVMLPYPPSALGLEVAFVFVFALIEWARLHQASKGNRMELIGPTLYALCLAVPVAVFHAYMFSLQTYVLRLDQIVNGIALAFLAVEVLFSALAIVAFWRSSRW